MLFKRKEDSKIDAEPHSFPLRTELLSKRIARRVQNWFNEHIPLFEAFTVAVSVHILAFPILWFIGWALPWPKSPEILTVIEIDLTKWPDDAMPKSVVDIYKSEMHPFK